MAAKRLGQFLSNVTGTSGQILRVKADESGFEMFTPTGLPAYTITNDTTDRVIDADVTTSDELADVLATLIKDITTMVGGPVAFQWSTSEQVYPFEKAADGSTLYAKEVAFGALPNNGTKTVAHNISGFNPRKLLRFETIAYYSDDTVAVDISSEAVGIRVNQTNVIMYDGGDFSPWSNSYFRLIYAK